MIERPTVEWRDSVREQRAALAAGTLAAEDAYAEELWPVTFTADVDAALDAYEAELRSLHDPDDAEILAAVERVVVDLNGIDERSGGCIETDEREQLCAYIDRALEAQGIDVRALEERCGVERFELAGRWRDW
ncbi:hypothetical protein [Hamadaea tsunoensis]|uniref:hypothetical protein n=1 Tax=Hamadaea tsunoensis TaxID=53368 RepID=UPI00041CA438|nr:hypothetical protein [Hamadaea tsunoensis]